MANSNLEAWYEPAPRLDSLRANDILILVFAANGVGGQSDARLRSISLVGELIRVFANSKVIF